jgi:hypothetical protein
MNTPSRKQFMELVTHFKLATEATKEALASEYDHTAQSDATAQRPITPMLAFCMERAGTRERAQAIFNHVLKISRISYWPAPEVASHLRGNQELKAICFKHFIVPVKANDNLLVLCDDSSRTVQGHRLGPFHFVWFVASFFPCLAKSFFADCGFGLSPWRILCNQLR